MLSVRLHGRPRLLVPAEERRLHGGQPVLLEQVSRRKVPVTDCRLRSSESKGRVSLGPPAPCFSCDYSEWHADEMARREGATSVWTFSSSLSFTRGGSGAGRVRERAWRRRRGRRRYLRE